MKKRNHWKLMLQLSGLVKPLRGYMVLAVLMGLAGHLCATFITVFAGFALLAGLGEPVSVSITLLFICVESCGTGNRHVTILLPLNSWRL